jgi:hypothetical protein
VPVMKDRPQARTTGVLTERLGDELVVYDTVTRSAHCLSADAARVWALCDGQRSPEELAHELGGVPEQVRRALQELGDAGLLESVPLAAHRISRRDAAKRIATIGAAAIGAPLIYSVAIPRAAAAASGTGGPTDLCAGKICNDNNVCTTDECDPLTGNCINTPVTCNDGNPCTTDRCDRELGCVYTAVPDGTSCGDGRECQQAVCVASLN